MDLPRAVRLSMEVVKGEREDYAEEYRYRTASRRLEMAAVARQGQRARCRRPRAAHDRHQHRHHRPQARRAGVARGRGALPLADRAGARRGRGVRRRRHRVRQPGGGAAGARRLAQRAAGPPRRGLRASRRPGALPRAPALPRRRAGHGGVRRAPAAASRRQRAGRGDRECFLPGARAPGDAVGGARRHRAAQGARGARRARAALPRRRRGLGRVRLGDRRAVALHLPVGARRGGARLPAHRPDRPPAARVHAAGRGAHAGRVLRPQRARRPAVPRPDAPLAHQVGQADLAAGERRAGARRARAADRLPRHRRRHHGAQAGRGAHPVSGHARRVDRPAQPGAARRPRRAGDPRRGAQPRAARAAAL